MKSYSHHPSFLQEVTSLLLLTIALIAPHGANHPTWAPITQQDSEEYGSENRLRRKDVTLSLLAGPPRPPLHDVQTNRQLPPGLDAVAPPVC